MRKVVEVEEVPEMTERRADLRLGVAALVLGGVLFAVYPAVRPYADETTAAGAEGFASTAWVVAHLCAVGFFGLLPFGLSGLRAAVQGTAGARWARRALLAGWVGVALVLPYYGAETFGLQAIGARTVASGDLSLLELADGVRFGAAATTSFAAGLLVLAAAGVLAALAVRRAARSWLGLPLAAGLILLTPQFFAPPALRIAHGVLLAAGCLALAAALRRRQTP